jgi:hypothetical protein
MHATAFIIGPTTEAGAALADIARTLRFAAVLPYGGIEAAESQAHKTPVCYFLFAPVVQIASLSEIAEAIRFCPSRRVRFSPMIYFSDKTSVEAISACINLGFDDIITMPFTQQRVSERIGRQVGPSLTYFETSSYFGPDRRDRVTAPNRPAETRLGGQFRRLEIVRSFEAGVSVLRDDSYAVL